MEINIGKGKRHDRDICNRGIANYYRCRSSGDYDGTLANRPRVALDLFGVGQRRLHLLSKCRTRRNCSYSSNHRTLCTDRRSYVAGGISCSRRGRGASELLGPLFDCCTDGYSNCTDFTTKSQTSKKAKNTCSKAAKETDRRPVIVKITKMIF